MTDFKTKINISENIIIMVKLLKFDDYETSIQQLNIINKFIVEDINLQIDVIKHTMRMINELQLYDDTYRQITDDDISQLVHYDIKVIDSFESMQEVRDFYLYPHPFNYFDSLQRYILKLFKQAELLYYQEYEDTNYDEVLKDIESKLDYMQDNEELLMMENENNYIFSTYKLQYLYDLFSNLV